MLLAAFDRAGVFCDGGERMTELARNWLMGIACAAMVLSLAESLSPEGSVKRVCRLAGGLVLMLTAISPVLKLEEIDLKGITDWYQAGVQEYQEKLEAENDFLYESIIAENTAAYILDKAEELGAFCQVTVTVAWTQDGLPQPHTVRITGNLTQRQRSELSRILESDLGIPLSLQYFEENTQ